MRTGHKNITNLDAGLVKNCSGNSVMHFSKFLVLTLPFDKQVQ